jgi:hypothetical protein
MRSPRRTSRRSAFHRRPNPSASRKMMRSNIGTEKFSVTRANLARTRAVGRLEGSAEAVGRLRPEKEARSRWR